MNRFLLFSVFGLLIFSACNEQSNTVDLSVKQAYVDDDFLRNQLDGVFEPITVFAHQSFPKAQVELGKKLYFDKALSKDGNISCNSCHNLSTFGVDNLPTSPGDLGELGERNSPTSIYASLHAMQFWDGRAKDVEEQAGMPILNPVEHNIPSKAFLEERLRGMDEYQELFSKAFPNEEEPITYSNLEKAIGAFERQLQPESRFDRYLQGDDKALTVEEKQGLQVFIDKECATCHNGIALGGGKLEKFGKYGDYWKLTKSKNIDDGLFALSGNENDKYRFKVPSLRNIEKTFPYFHDGSVETLEEAIAIMGKLQTKQELSETDVASIATFLKALTADVDAQFKMEASL